MLLKLLFTHAAILCLPFLDMVWEILRRLEHGMGNGSFFLPPLVGASIEVVFQEAEPEYFFKWGLLVFFKRT